MVFHNIEKLTEVISGHRVIMYYIKDVSESKLKLCSSVERVMDMLGKKNDELLIFEVDKKTQQFNQFKELYKPEIIDGAIALFVINDEGLPLICEQIQKVDDLYSAINAICIACHLNNVSSSEITKAVNWEPETHMLSVNNVDVHIRKGEVNRNSENGNLKQVASVIESQIPSTDSDSDIKGGRNSIRSSITELQIRLPNGTKQIQKFDKNAFLQEVHDLVRSKFQLNDFDLKTYNRHIFSAADYEKTLEDLDLTPNGVIIVVYKNVVPFNNSNSLSNKIQYGFWVIFGKVMPIFRYIQGLMYAFWTSFFTSANVRPDSRQIENQDEGSQSNNHRGAFKRGKKSSPKYGSNIHTLRRRDGSDDENNRYNGNSTQQK